MAASNVSLLTLQFRDGCCNDIKNIKGFCWSYCTRYIDTGTHWDILYSLVLSTSRFLSLSGKRNCILGRWWKCMLLWWNFLDWQTHSRYDSCTVMELSNCKDFHLCMFTFWLFVHKVISREEHVIVHVLDLIIYWLNQLESNVILHGAFVVSSDSSYLLNI